MAHCPAGGRGRPEEQRKLATYFGPTRAQGSSLSLNTLYRELLEHPDHRMRFLSIDGSQTTKTFSEVHADVLQLMAELRDCGVGAGDLVGLMGPNSYEWVLADLALLGLECLSVALPAERRTQPDAVRELAEKYRLSAVLVTKALPVGSHLPEATGLLEERPLKFDKRAVPDDARPAIPADVFSIAFSSGTSGTKKGLMMSKVGVENTMRVSAGAWQVTEDDNVLIVMPFSNFQQRYLMYTAVRYGLDATVVAPERMFQKLREFNPTIILGPPSFFEVAYNRVNAGSVRDKLPYYVATALHTLARGRFGHGVRAWLGRKWMSMYGSRVRLMLTGSAPVPPRTVRLFQRLGAPLFEVYGSTESGWICFNLPQRHRIGSAGRPVDGVDVTLAEDGEVLVGTAYPQTLGYVFEGEETQQSVYLKPDQLAMGDIGEFDRSGFLRLVGRKKNVIITRSGVKINPEELEEAVEKSCRITKAIVVSPGSDGLLTCVVWLDDPESAARRTEVESCVEELNRKGQSSHRMVDVLFRPAGELSVENGLLTRNFKVDRGAVMRKIFTEGSRGAR
ncbi:AMP-binding protein [Streptomyces sp. NPDC014636]|uniref:AMP-binding protein n=1 Tax=Streptomyces sp. NPDC014636 TaxID=3364876 RepID=UPI0036FD918A